MPSIIFQLPLFFKSLLMQRKDPVYISLGFVDGKLLRKLLKCLHESSILRLSLSEVLNMELLLEALGMSKTNL